ncbi:alcohol dehydrogenase catalytic domain-containing protein [Ktedonospora formicarum]|uniref:Sorbitol dehydrogenase n=1 Tax=Ktedonospora formicarum TaxID=2778364 RepID=A0A8J3HZA8_9CHLR|nr:alcohol dehydrogenase catalytic domain-containing protein [Ktedonospora formicarum]GHO43402.1 sorbitol dehydrogenase [Ktedonospora formicarum]
MKAVIYHSYNHIQVEQVPVPAINEHELLVRVHGCGLCGSDILKITRKAPPPVVLGHELTGSIVALGKAVRGFQEGQRVVVAHHVPCGNCHYCLRGNVSMCAAFKASNIDPCGLAEYIRVPAPHVQHTTLLLPETLSAEEGSFTEPLACCVRAVRRTPLHDGDCIVVVGLGSIGLLMLQAVKALARRSGLSLQVYGIDILPERLDRALALGADKVAHAPTAIEGLHDLLREYTEGRGADAAILTVPGALPFQQALTGLRAGGTLNVFAAHTGDIPFNPETLYQRELSLISTYSSSPEDLRIALDLLNTREVRVADLISHHLPLERFQEGVQHMRQRSALKIYFQITGETNGK